jgi:hypothetical protein
LMERTGVSSETSNLIWAIGANLAIFAFGLVVAKPEAFGALHEGGRWGVRRLAFG